VGYHIGNRCADWFFPYNFSGWSSIKAFGKSLCIFSTDAKNDQVSCCQQGSAVFLKMLVDSLDLFQELGIDVISYKENIDTTTSMGRLTFHINSAYC
jgi:hypothetical protein